MLTSSFQSEKQFLVCNEFNKHWIAAKTSAMFSIYLYIVSFILLKKFSPNFSYLPDALSARVYLDF